MASREWQIDCEMADLIRKFVRKDNVTTPGDRDRLDSLQRERADRMMPAATRRKRT